MIRNIIGYKKRYWINESGQVYSYSKNDFLNQRDRNGYLAVTLWNGKNSKTFNVHRLVAKHFIPNPLKKKQVNHKDGNKYNNNSDNLEWCSPKDNSKHRDKLGLQRRKYNEDAYNWKLFNKEIRAIKKMYKNYNLNQYEIADILECSQPYVSQVLSGKKRAKAIQAIEG